MTCDGIYFVTSALPIKRLAIQVHQNQKICIINAIIWAKKNPHVSPDKVYLECDASIKFKVKVKVKADD